MKNWFRLIWTIILSVLPRKYFTCMTHRRPLSWRHPLAHTSSLAQAMFSLYFIRDQGHRLCSAWAHGELVHSTGTRFSRLLMFLISKSQDWWKNQKDGRRAVTEDSATLPAALKKGGTFMSFWSLSKSLSLVLPSILSSSLILRHYGVKSAMGHVVLKLKAVWLLLSYTFNAERRNMAACVSCLLL